MCKHVTGSDYLWQAGQLRQNLVKRPLARPLGDLSSTLRSASALNLYCESVQGITEQYAATAEVTNGPTVAMQDVLNRLVLASDTDGI